MYPSGVAISLSLQFVVCYDVLGHVHEPQSHIFIPCHWSVEVEVLDVHSHEFCIGCADDAIEEELDCECTLLPPATNLVLFGSSIFSGRMRLVIRL